MECVCPRTRQASSVTQRRRHRQRLAREAKRFNCCQTNRSIQNTLRSPFWEQTQWFFFQANRIYSRVEWLKLEYWAVFISQWSHCNFRSLVTWRKGERCLTQQPVRPDLLHEAGELLACSSYSNCTLLAWVSSSAWSPWNSLQQQEWFTALTRHSLPRSFSPCPDNYNTAHTEGRTAALSCSSWPILGVWGLFPPPPLFCTFRLLAFLLYMHVAEAKRVNPFKSYKFNPWECGKALTNKKVRKKKLVPLATK